MEQNINIAYNIVFAVKHYISLSKQIAYNGLVMCPIDP